MEGTALDAQGRPIADATVSFVSTRPDDSGLIVFNSTVQYPTTTSELIAHTNANGIWSMTGIDFVLGGRPRVRMKHAVFEAVAAQPLRTSRLELDIDPEPGANPR